MTNVRTGELQALPTGISIEQAGIRCGGRSKLNVKRKHNTDLNVVSSTSDDVVALLRKLDLASPCRPQSLFVENVVEFAENESAGAAGPGFEVEFRQAMEQRGYMGASRLVDSLSCGGVQSRKRWASFDVDTIAFPVGLGQAAPQAPLGAQQITLQVF